MSARSRRRTAIALTVTLTAGAAALLTGCGPTNAKAAVSPGTRTTAQPAAAGTPRGGSRPDSAAGGAPVANGTAHNGLTISDGTRYVVMNGTRVDFGTDVRDLAWAPDGRKAAFVDSAGDLVVTGPDGGGRVVVARNPGGQTWSHPTWQVTPYDKQDRLPARDNLLFTVARSGTTRLDIIAATAVDGTPKPASLNPYMGEGSTALPKTGNLWPDVGGTHGTAVYANSGNGEVYIRDDYLRQQGGRVAPGSEPAMSPLDDEEIVFVRSVGGHDHLFVEKSGDKGFEPPRDLTPHATTDYTEPAFSADGRTIAARTPSGIATLPADGSAAPVLVSGYRGLPAYRG